MTMDEATGILNQERHHGHSKWYISENGFVCGEDQYEFFEPFEAVAIAEKYASGGILPGYLGQINESSSGQHRAPSGPPGRPMVSSTPLADRDVNHD